MQILEQVNDVHSLKYPDDVLNEGSSKPGPVNE